MPMTPSPSGTFSTPDQDESNQMDYWLAQLAAQVEAKMLGTTTGDRRRVHVQTGLTGTTDATGYCTFNHGAPFTPRACQVIIAGSGLSLGYLISSGAITATTVQARFGAWNAATTLNGSNLGSNAITIISWE